MKYQRILIGGYEALVNKRGVIVETDPAIKKLRYEKLGDVLEQYYRRTTFDKIEDVEPPLFVGEDKYKAMLKKNPNLEYLKNKFDCDVW